MTPLTDEAVKASISLGNLKHALRITAMANSKGNLIPTLQGVRMEQISDGLALEATDLDIAIRVVLAEMGGPQKPIITPAAKLTDWAKLLTGDQDVNISATDKRATVKCGRAKVQLPLIDASGWPEIPFGVTAESVTLTQGPFTRALRFAQIAVSDEESRYTLNAMQVESDGESLKVVATEGHVMMIYAVPCEAKFSLLVPSRMAKTLLALLTDDAGGVNIAFNDSKIIASIDAESKICISHGRLQGSFPNWRTVFPKGKRTDITVNAGELLAALERCLLLTDERARALDFTFTDGEILIQGANAGDGEAEDSVTCQGTPEGGEYKTRLNGEFVRDLLRKLSGDVTIAVPKDYSALLFKAQPHEGETLDYVVMPMRM